MGRHSAGKYGRMVGRPEPDGKAPPASGAWCYRCGTDHRWDEPCPAETRKRREKVPA